MTTQKKRGALLTAAETGTGRSYTRNLAAAERVLAGTYHLRRSSVRAEGSGRL